MKDQLGFKYAIINNKTRQYYLGTTRASASDNFGPPSIYDPVYTYTENGAHKKIASFPEFFKNCSVVRFIP